MRWSIEPCCDAFPLLSARIHQQKFLLQRSSYVIPAKSCQPQLYVISVEANPHLPLSPKLSPRASRPHRLISANHIQHQLISIDLAPRHLDRPSSKVEGQWKPSLFHVAVVGIRHPEPSIWLTRNRAHPRRRNFLSSP
jgi:hypothetical protein